MFTGTITGELDITHLLKTKQWKKLIELYIRKSKTKMKIKDGNKIKTKEKSYRNYTKKKSKKKD